MHRQHRIIQGTGRPALVMLRNDRITHAPKQTVPLHLTALFAHVSKTSNVSHCGPKEKQCVPSYPHADQKRPSDQRHAHKSLAFQRDANASSHLARFYRHPSASGPYVDGEQSGKETAVDRQSCQPSVTLVAIQLPDCQTEVTIGMNHS